MIPQSNYLCLSIMYMLRVKVNDFLNRSVLQIEMRNSLEFLKAYYGLTLMVKVQQTCGFNH